MTKKHGQNTDNFRKMGYGEGFNGSKYLICLVEPMGVEPTTS